MSTTNQHIFIQFSATKVREVLPERVYFKEVNAFDYTRGKVNQPTMVSAFHDWDLTDSANPVCVCFGSTINTDSHKDWGKSHGTTYSRDKISQEVLHSRWGDVGVQKKFLQQYLAAKSSGAVLVNTKL